jgi:hypothetical protein
MSKTISKEIYSFKELIELEKEGKVSTRTLEHVREKLQGWATDGSWWYESVYDTWKSALEQIGFENADISFSGFWSQGDGASFTATIDLPRLLDFMNSDIEPKPAIEPFPGQDGSPNPKEDFRPWILSKVPNKFYSPVYRRYLRLLPVSAWITATVARQDNRYSHPRTCRVEIEIPGYREHRRVEALVADLQPEVVYVYERLCEAIYRNLENEYEWRCADEQLIEDCEANERHFDLSGRAE